VEENRARRVVDALRDRGIDAHMLRAGVDQFGVRVNLHDGRQAEWDTVARTNYDQPVATERPVAPPPGPALSREGGVFRRFLGGFREQ